MSRRCFGGSQERQCAGDDSGTAVAGFAALVSLLLYEHAFVQAGQSVPLA